MTSLSDAISFLSSNFGEAASSRCFTKESPVNGRLSPIEAEKRIIREIQVLVKIVLPLAGRIRAPALYTEIPMKTVFLVGLAAFTAALHAQSAGNPILSESRANYNQIKTNLTGMAEKMLAENYDFKPVPEIRSFGELMAHIADAQMRTCSSLNGSAKNADAASKKTKDEIVAALKASFAECDAAWEGTNEGNATQMIAGRGGQRSRAGTLIFISVTHNNEEYGYGSLYLRLKNVVPPSSDRGTGGRKQ
jgi:DinB superfamily